MVATPIGTDTILRRNEKIIATNLDQEVVMMHIDRGSYFGLDPVGSDIWHFADEPKTVGDICDYLMSRYAVERALCEKEVRQFLTTMVDNELFHVQAPGNRESI